MSKRKKRKKRIITDEIKLRRKYNRKRQKDNHRRFFQFFVAPLNGYNHIKSYYMNGNRYWIAYFREIDDNKQRYIVMRYATEEELKIIRDACGASGPLIDIALCNNMREGLNAIKKDAENPIAVKDLFDFERYGNIYKEMKEIFKEEGEDDNE